MINLPGTLACNLRRRKDFRNRTDADLRIGVCPMMNRERGMPSGKKLLIQRVLHDFRVIPEIEFLKYVSSVRAYSLDTQIEFFCNLADGLSGGEVMEDFILAVRK